MAPAVIERAMGWDGAVSIVREKNDTVRVYLAFEPCSDDEPWQFAGEPVSSEMEVVVEGGKYSVSRMNFTNPVDPQKYWDEQEDLISESKDVKAVLAAIDDAVANGETEGPDFLPSTSWTIDDRDFPWGPLSEDW